MRGKHRQEERAGGVVKIEARNDPWLDEHDLSPFAAVDVLIREWQPRCEKLEAVVPVNRTGQDMCAQRSQVIADEAGLLLQFAASGGRRELARLDPTADEAPPVGIDGRVLVPFLQEQPATRIHQAHQGDAVHHVTVSAARP